MNGVIKIGGAKAEPGTRSCGHLRVAETVDGAPVNVPIIIVNGAMSGAKLWIQSGTHGDEYEGLEVIRRLL